MQQLQATAKGGRWEAESRGHTESSREGQTWLRVLQLLRELHSPVLKPGCYLRGNLRVRGTAGSRPPGLTCTSDSRTSGASERRGWKELSRVLSCSAVRAGRLRVGRGPRAALLKPAGGRKGTESLWLQVLPTGDRLSSLGRRRSSGLTQTPHPLPLCTGPFGKAVSFDYRDRPPPSVGLGRGAGGSEGWWSPFYAKAGGARQTASGTTSWVSVEPV